MYGIAVYCYLCESAALHHRGSRFRVGRNSNANLLHNHLPKSSHGNRSQYRALRHSTEDSNQLPGIMSRLVESTTGTTIVSARTLQQEEQLDSIPTVKTSGENTSEEDVIVTLGDVSVDSVTPVPIRNMFTIAELLTPAPFLSDQVIVQHLCEILDHILHKEGVASADLVSIEQVLLQIEYFDTQRTLSLSRTS